MNDNGSKLVWFFTGMIVGAAAGVLFAPQSGVETRRLITTKAEAEGREWMERGKEFYDKGRQLADDAAEYFEEGRKLVEG
jgi:gas vesicle protein